MAYLFVCRREFAEVMTDVLRSYLYCDELFPIMNANIKPNHFGGYDHITSVGSDNDLLSFF